MKKITLFIGMVVIMATSSMAQIVNIPNANFKAALLAIAGLDANSDGDIQYSEATALSGTLDVSIKSISNLTGIEAFTNIISLNCSNNSLPTLDVSANTALQTLFCYTNSLTSLNVSGLTSLYKIYCYGNQLPTLDVSSNTALTDLYCNDNQLTSLDVSANTALEYLYCQNNQLLSLNTSDVAALTYLLCQYNSLTGLNVSANTALTYLDCGSNSLTSLNVKNGNNTNFILFMATINPDLTCIQVDDAAYSTANWTNIDGLESFSIDCACIVTILDANFKAALVGNPGININGDGDIQCFEATAYTGTIDVSYQNIIDLTGIEAFTNIAFLDCSNNSLTSLDVSYNIALTSLGCSNNSLTSLNVKNTNNSNFTNFNATSNSELTCIQVDIAAYSTATWLNIDGMEGFSENCSCVVNIPDDIFRSYLLNSPININSDGIIDCDEATAYEGNIIVNGLGIADLTGIEAFTKIQFLDCSNNSLTALDVSGLTSLVRIDCYQNQLTSLNVYGLTSLIQIVCHHNLLASLDVSSNTALEYLTCEDNSLTSLDLLTNTALISLGCSNNSLTSLDVSANTTLISLGCSNNSLTSLNVKNTNNSNFTNFNATSNSELTCIQVDIAAYSTATWLNIDGMEGFSENCSCVVNIPDDIFRSYLLNSPININSDGIIDCDEATAYEGNIIVNGLGIADLTGIETFTKIAFLNCSNNSLTSLNVSNNTALTSLNCSNNSLTSLNVSNNTALTSLTCNNNSLMTVDVSINAALTALYCNNNHLTSLNVKNTNNSNFTNFNATNNPDLTCIQIDGGGVDYSGSHWINKDAGASYNEVCTVNIPDPNFKAALVGNGIDINGDGKIQYDEASACAGSIYVNGLVIIDLTGIEAFTNITSLDCSYNSLTSLNVSANTALEYLYCNNNSLRSLDVSGLTSLYEIYCYENQLPTLDVSSNTALQYLYCYTNLLTSLKVSGLTSLTEIKCYDNQLSTLDVSSNTALEYLYCYNNSLTSLKVSGLTSLYEIYCYENQLPTLDVSSNTALEYLYCYTNLLTSLNVFDLASLTEIDCHGNHLPTLDVSSNTALEYLYCNNNTLTSLNVQNGNNTNISNFNANNNPALTCIQVDDAAWSYANWPNKDAGAVYNTNCSNCIVNIPDANFKAGLLAIASLDANSDDEIQCTEATSWTGTIDVSNKNISDLTGIESFTHITNLTCNNNTLTSLNVSSNLALEYLDCRNNSLTSLNVSNNTSLTSLYCNNNSLSSLNVKNGNNASLLDFDATNNLALTCIQVDNAALSDAKWTNKDAGASFNEFCGWSTVNIPDAIFKAALVDDPSINTSGDTEIQYDEALAYLNGISVSGLGISDLTGIEAFTNIFYLDCSSNSLTSLDVSSNTALGSLYCNNNSLTSLVVSGLTSLTYIDCSNNQLTGLDASLTTNLQYLFCQYNSLTSLNVSGLTSLSVISCSNNQLASLNFSSNTALYYLDCSYNTLTGLNVQNGNNTNFSSFNATYNTALTCIQVDDADFMNLTFSGGINGIESFSTDCGADLTWTGNNDTDWNTVSNWDMGFVPSGSNNITIPVVVNDPIVNEASGTPAVCNNITIESGAILTIAAGKALTVSGTLTNNSTGGVVIQSDATGTGSLITTAAEGTGIAFAECYMTTGAWHQVSPPLALQNVSDFLTAEGNVTNIATKNTTDRAMMNYNPLENTWSAFYTNESAPGNFEAGQGYMMRTDYNSAVIFAGVITTGSPTVYLSGAGDTGWNLIGNPYTSAIDLNSNTASDFLTANPAGSILDESSLGVYVWNQVSEIYDPINWATDPDVASLGQAFFVKSYSGGAGVTFNSGMQLHSSTGLKSAKSAYPEIKLIAVNNGTKAATSIKFISGTTKGLDPGYDAGLFSLGSTVSLYTKLVEDNGVNFMLQCLPANDYSSMIIPVGINSKAGGQVVFRAEAINLPDECKIILEDKLTKTFTDLSKNDYTATIAANSSITDRFQLHTSYLTTGLNIGVGEGITDQLSAYAIHNTEIRVKGQISKQAIATLYDIQGRVVLIKNLEEGILNVIETPNLRTGIYLLSVKDNNRVQGFKIPVSE